jgi:hypothetical protein
MIPLLRADAIERRRLIAHLKSKGKYDNTLIVFISDNGAAGEDMAELVNKLPRTAKDWFAKTYDNRPENWGRPGSCVEYGPSWAQVGSVPFRLFKGVEAEGGIRAPLIVSGPGVKHEGAINDSVLHVMDIVPTFLQSAGVEHPAKKKGSTVAPPQGKSMWPLLAGRETATRTDSDWLGWLGFIAPLKPGSVMGFGTIPDCTGCDHDDFIDPGAEIQITVERLGTLHCRLAEPTGKLLPSRWPVREPLRKYH